MCGEKEDGVSVGAVVGTRRTGLSEAHAHGMRLSNQCGFQGLPRNTHLIHFLCIIHLVNFMRITREVAPSFKDEVECKLLQMISSDRAMDIVERRVRHAADAESMDDLDRLLNRFVVSHRICLLSRGKLDTACSCDPFAIL